MDKIKLKELELCGNEEANNATDAIQLLNMEFAKYLRNFPCSSIQSIKLDLTEDKGKYKAEFKLEYEE